MYIYKKILVGQSPKCKNGLPIINSSTFWEKLLIKVYTISNSCTEVLSNLLFGTMSSTNWSRPVLLLNIDNKYKSENKCINANISNHTLQEFMRTHIKGNG